MMGTKDNMSHLFSMFRELQLADEEFRSMCNVLYDRAMQDGLFMLVGSGAEGATVPRLFLEKPLYEIDMMKLQDGQAMMDAMVPKGGAEPGTFVFKGANEQLENLDFSISIYMPLVRILQFGYSRFNKSQQKSTGERSTGTRRWKAEAIRTGPAGTFAMDLQTFSLHDYRLMADFLVAHHIQGWPKESSEWLTRDRHWPPQNIVRQAEEIGYHIVRKPLVVTPVQQDIEYRLTFTKMEALLAKSRTRNQNLVYLIAKTIHYYHLNLSDPEDPKVSFPSYATKTVMMWLLEQTPEDQWKDDNQLLRLLDTLLDQLQSAVQAGFLRQYFLPKVNIISRCTPSLLKLVGTKLVEIRKSSMCELFPVLSLDRIQTFRNDMLSCKLCMLKEILILLSAKRGANRKAENAGNSNHSGSDIDLDILYKGSKVKYPLPDFDRFVAAIKEAHVTYKGDINVASLTFKPEVEHPKIQCIVHSFLADDGPEDKKKFIEELTLEVKKTFSDEELASIGRLDKGEELCPDERLALSREFIVTQYCGDLMVFPVELGHELLTQYMGQLSVKEGGDFAALWYHVLRPAIERLMFTHIYNSTSAIEIPMTI